MTLSMKQYSNPMPSFDFDDLFSLPIDAVFDEEFNQFVNFDDELICNNTDVSFESEPYPSKTSPTEMLLSNLKCGVCGAPASGYNFDQITCESCKAFFRRNALRNMPDLKCRLDGSCVINVHTRRQCTYCRLKKCFDIKMRKDWIRTEEETKLRQLQKLIKQERKVNGLGGDLPPIVQLPIVVRKKKRLLIKPTNVVHPISSAQYFGFHRNLADEDQVWLNNITNAYQVGADRADYSFITRYTDSTTLSEFINDESTIHSSLIYYYKSVREFKMLDLDDQVLLIKSNFLNIIHLHHIIVENFEDSPHIGKHMTKWINGDFHEQMSRTRRCFYRFTKHPLLLKLTLIVLVFSTNISTAGNGSQSGIFKNTQQLFQCQNCYTALLWRYLNHLFSDEEAALAMELIVRQILRYQMLMIIMDDQVRQTSRHVKFNELMESIFGLS